MKKMSLVLFLLFLNGCLTFVAQVRKDPSVDLYEGNKVYINVVKEHLKEVHNKATTTYLDDITVAIIKDEASKYLQKKGLVIIDDIKQSDFTAVFLTSSLLTKKHIPGGASSSSGSYIAVDNPLVGTSGSSSSNYSRWESHDVNLYGERLYLSIYQKNKKSPIISGDVYPEKANESVLANEKSTREMVKTILSRALFQKVKRK